MPVDFTLERWDRIRETYRSWWAGELDRPLIHMVLHGRDPGRPEPRVPGQNFTAFYGTDASAEDIVDRWDYDLSCHEYLGDGFPSVWPNFGAGVAAAMLGARLENRPDTVWFHPDRIREISDLRLTHDPDNVWLRRIKDICRAAMDRWQGSVQVSMTDLGGASDVLSVFRPGQGMLLDLIDHPGEVTRCMDEIHELWWQYYREINDVLQPVNPGYTAWTPIYSEEPYYMLQSDFCYMIGPDMFDQFVKPELAASCRKLGNAFYHLDGPGQLPHLDSLLEIEELAGVQWVPGDGSPLAEHWPEVYRKIRAAGKLVQVFGGQFTNQFEALDVLTDQLGDSRGIIIYLSGGMDQRDEAMRVMERYGVPV
jgi:hypothetical protein